MKMRQVRAPRPPKTRSVSHPLISMPIKPEISNAATIQLARVRSICLASFSSVGPQSRTAYRTE